MGSTQERKRIYIVLGVFGALALITPFLDLFLQSLVTEILVFGIQTHAEMHRF